MMTVDEAAVFMWRLLETQGKCGCTWETFKEVQKNLITVLNRETIYSVKKSETVKMSQHSPQHIQHNIQKITTALTHSLASFTNKTTNSKKTSLNS